MPRRGVTLPSLQAQLGRAFTLPPRRLRLTASPPLVISLSKGPPRLDHEPSQTLWNMLPTADEIPEEYRVALLAWLQHLPIPYDERCNIDISTIPIA